MNKKILIVIALGLAFLVSFSFPTESISFIAAESVLRSATVVDNGDEFVFLTGAETVSEIMRVAGIELSGFDRMSHSPESPVWDGITLYIEREVRYFIQVDMQEPVLRHGWAGITVEEALIQFMQEDGQAYVTQEDLFRDVGNDDILRFESWSSRVEVEITPIPYGTETNHTRNVWQGRQMVRQEGVTGEYAVYTQVIYVGGVEVNRDVFDEGVRSEPITEIIDIGTGRLGALVDTDAPDFHYYRRLIMEATAYTSGYGCTGKHPWDPWYRITASGREVEHGIVAVDRTIIPLGTRLYVQGYGFAIAADVGGAIRGYSIDLFMEELEDALNFGRRFLNVWVLDNIWDN